jgi:SagB-type dehydrogenase family enzyme
MKNYRYPLSVVPERESALATVYLYHDRTKHHSDRYARSLGYMDWANQPNPFRRFDSAPLIQLPVPEIEAEPTYDTILAAAVPPARVDIETISKLFFFSLALSAWKQVKGLNGEIVAQWSLRVNPSSGNLHPTEGYLICGPSPGLGSFPGIYHYAPFEHALELRRRLTDDEWCMLSPRLSAGACLVGLTSIYWRESWKYGERAFRYCQHDVGHAIGAVAISAGSLGWRTRLLEQVSIGALERFLGIDRQQGVEAEHGESLLLLDPDRESVTDFALPEALLDSLAGGECLGEPNRLSSEHHPWPVIDEVSEACAWPGSAWTEAAATATGDRSPLERGLSAHQLIRQRRSAVALDGRTQISSEAFYRILQNVLPQANPIPFATLPWRPAVSLLLFVHRVSGLAEGLYVLMRHPAQLESLRRSFRPDFIWKNPEGCPPSVPLYLLSTGDERAVARTVSCGQDIAADGVFSAGMLAAFDEALSAAGPGMYPRLFWETGVIGQVLYLEAEAAGIQATGIGCFHDDEVHRIVGINDHSWQSLYHFTMGGAVEDPRVQSFDAYRHLVNDRRGE